MNLHSSSICNDFTKEDDVWNMTKRAKEITLPQSYRSDSRAENQECQSKRTKQRKIRCDLFMKEKERQRKLIPRIERIVVKYEGLQFSSPETLIVNKNISTPYNVAQYLSGDLVSNSALCLVDGQIWEMHRPLVADCTIQFLTFFDENPHHLNKAFWRSCSVMLGAVLESAFNGSVELKPRGIPFVDVSSGAFVYDIEVKRTCESEMATGGPSLLSRVEMQALSAAMHRLSENSSPFERLTVNQNCALKMFESDEHKYNRVKQLCFEEKNGEMKEIVVYRIGEHVELCGGPLIANTSFLGRRCSIMAVHEIAKGDDVTDDSDEFRLFRFQGVALPRDMFLNHFAYGILERRAEKLIAL